MSSQSHVSLPAQREKSEMDGTSEDTEETGSVEVMAMAEANSVKVNSGLPRVWREIEEERR